MQVPPIDLPVELEPYIERLQQTIRPCIKIIPHPDYTNTPSLWNSKIGGNPYLPVSMEYPTNTEGKYLVFLAQINFSEVPMLEPFPREGILQFFIGNTDLYGMSFDKPTLQENFRVIFHQEIIQQETQLHQDFSFLPDFNKIISPFTSEKKQNKRIAFKEQFEAVPPSDHEFDHYFNRDELGDEIMDHFYENIHSQGSKLGGYAYFVQEDPRPYRKLENMRLLLQLSSEEDLGLLWGDVGEANFFIDYQNLAKKDFSEILYNWDCS